MMEKSSVGIVLTIALALLASRVTAMTKEQREEMRRKVGDMFYHGYNRCRMPVAASSQPFAFSAT